MARYIDATPAQRWRQYDRPSLLREISEAPLMETEWAAMIGRYWTLRRETGDRHRWNRRIRAEIINWRDHRAYIARCRKIIAERG
jgi:hypothetical protein